MARWGGVSSGSAARPNRRASSRVAEEALVTACDEGSLLSVKALLASGTNANSLVGTGCITMTALHAACRGGHAGIASLLLGAGAEINQSIGKRWTPLHIACENGHTLVVALLLRRDGIDVNGVIEDGSTPLYLACCEGHHEVVELLLRHDGIDVNQKNGTAPL